MGIDNALNERVMLLLDLSVGHAHRTTEGRPTEQKKSFLGPAPRGARADRELAELDQHRAAHADHRELIVLVLEVQRGHATPPPVSWCSRSSAATPPELAANAGVAMVVVMVPLPEVQLAARPR